MTIELPADVLESAGISEDEVRLEIALVFYKAERLSQERAVELTGLSVALFMDALARRSVGLHLAPQNIAEDSGALTPALNSRPLGEAPMVVGVDVGGLGKGFHVVALANGCFVPRHFKEAKECMNGFWKYKRPSLRLLPLVRAAHANAILARERDV